MNMMYEVLNALNLGIVIIDDKRNIVFLNRWIEDKTNVSSQDSVDLAIENVFHRFKEKRYLNVLTSVRESNHSRFLSGSIHGTLFSDPLKEDKAIERQNVHIHSLTNGFILIYVEDVSQAFKEQLEFKKFIKQLAEEKDSIKVQEEKERQLARTDALTGLHNRLALTGYLKDGFVDNKLRETKRKFVVFFIDLDDFKDINDTYGHKYGDIVLIEVAKRLKQAVRQDDFVSRISGDEFIVVVEGDLSESKQEEIAGKIYSSVNQPIKHGDLMISVSVSMGISVYPKDGESIDEIIDKADQALYLSKKSGKGIFTIYNVK